MQFDNVQLNNGSIKNFARGSNLLPIQVGNLTVNGTAATATLSGNTPGTYGIGVIVTNINGAGNTLNVNDGGGVTLTARSHPASHWPCKAATTTRWPTVSPSTARLPWAPPAPPPAPPGCPAACRW